MDIDDLSQIDAIGGTDQISPMVDDVITIDPHLVDLHNATSLDAIASCYEGTDFGNILKAMSEGLSGTNLPGMEIVKTSVEDVCSFYHIDPVKVSYDPSGPGAYWGGLTSSRDDDWICGNPFMLRDMTLEFASVGHEQDYINIIFAHEMGHFWVDHLGLGDDIPYIANEAAADFLAGMYAGAKGLDPDGFSRFLSSLPEEGQFSETGEQLYPGGSERVQLFMDGYNTAQGYTWHEFQSIIDDHEFDLRAAVLDVAKKYI